MFIVVGLHCIALFLQCLYTDFDGQSSIVVFKLLLHRLQLMDTKHTSNLGVLHGAFTATIQMLIHDSMHFNTYKLARRWS